MKKAILFATVLTMTAMLSPMTTEAAGNVRVKIVTQENCQEWIEQLKDGKNLENCFGLKYFILNGACPDIPDEPVEPEIPNIPNEPDVPNTPEQSPSDEETEAITFAEQVVALVNAERAKEGLAALTIEEGIEKAALVRAKEIQSHFSHTRPDGSSFSTALKEADVTYRSAGENIAWGQRTPEEVVNAWMNSPGHRANIMNANYTRIGVGHLQNTVGTSYWVQLFAN